MASFSNEFEFDPLRGPVKDFSQTLLDEHDVVVKKVSAQLSRGRVFRSADPGRCGEQNRRHAAAGRQLLRRRAHPREAAAPAGQVSAGGDACRRGELETDDNGFIISARGKETTATYRYDSDGYPLGKTTTAKEERFTVASTPSKDPRKKLDYTAISTFNDRTLGTVRQTCDYDDHDNPLSCELQVVDESVQPPLTRHYTIKNRIDYY